MSNLADLHAALAVALHQQTGADVQVAQLVQIAGGASHELWRCQLTVAAGPWQGTHALVMQRPLGGKIFADALDLPTEFRLLQVLHAAGLPVPRPYWWIDDLLGRPAALAQYLAGVGIGRRIVKDPELVAARGLLPGQMGAALAAIHQIDLDAAHVRAALPAPPPGMTPAEAQIVQMEADLDRIDEPHPAIELVLRWLRRNAPPPPDRLVLVHGDYRIGNMLVVPAGLSGVLDWEFAHIGDPYEDLTWGLIREWRFGVDGLRFGGVGQPEAFFAAYTQHGGMPVDVQHAFYWEVMHNARWAVGTLNQAERHLSGNEPNLEFASLGRRCAEMEFEALSLITRAPGD